MESRLQITLDVEPKALDVESQVTSPKWIPGATHGVTTVYGTRGTQ